MTQLDVQESPEGLRISVRVKPRASKSRVLPVRGQELEVQVAAPPVDGEANRELSSTLARFFGVSASSVSVVNGARGRHKRVEVRGLSRAALLEALSRIDDAKR